MYHIASSSGANLHFLTGVFFHFITGADRTYTISFINQGTNGNYDITWVNGTLTINRRPTDPPGDYREPGTSPSTFGGGGTITIDDEDIPLANIPDEPLPLAGGFPIEIAGMIGAAILAAGALLGRKKEEEEETL